MAPFLLRSLLLCAALCASVSFAQSHTATRLRVEYIDSPITVDVAIPRFSYALVHPTRAQNQTNYQIVVKTALGVPVWDSGVVVSAKSLNIGYGGPQLTSNTDYQWSVTWQDANGILSTPVSSTFSTALYTAADWAGAQWVSTANNGSLNVYRAEFNVPTTAAPPIRARLFVHGLGYAKTWINGVITDDHELGTFTTFEKRSLYDVVDVTPLIRSGCNAIGVMLGHGWWSQHTVNAGDRQVRLLLTLTAVDGTITTLASKLSAGGDPNALVFTASTGPVTADDIYIGETYDARIAASIAGWTQCNFPGSSTWAATVAPAVSPVTYSTIISSQNEHAKITTDRVFSASTISQPFPNIFVIDFAQNMAGQTTLRVEDCPVGTVITLSHAEILFPNFTVHNNYLPNAPMRGTYICAGTGGIEEYRTLFSYYGFRYVQIEGFPGVPGEEAVTAHFIHSDVPQSGEFSSSSPLLNAIQHATRYASWSNLMNIPTDCPQRERRGWLGDAQLSFETVIYNVDGGGFYTKWLNDFSDTQVYDNETMQTDGALPDCVPFYKHGHPDADAGWGIAGFTITDWFSDYYNDDVFDVAWYPSMKWYANHWIKIATATPDGIFPLFFWGEFAEGHLAAYLRSTIITLSQS